MRKTKDLNKKTVGADASVRPTSKARQNKGITLIALVITIIVMLILVAVTITVAVNGGLFNYAGKATSETKNAIAKEQELANLEANMTVDQLIDKYTNAQGGTEEKTYLGMDNEETDSGIGYYVYVDGQYGVVYADLAYSRIDCQWYSSSGAYSYAAKDHDELKKYYLDGTYDPGDEYGTAWGEKPLLVADEEINETEGRTIDRFYVMALTNFTSEGNTTFCWNENLSNQTTFGTSTEFGTGWDNTYNKLVNTVLGTWDDSDIWNNLSSSNGWFVPSSAEWSAFAQEIVKENYSNYGLSYCYWSSSQQTSAISWAANFNNGFMSGYAMINGGLSRAFYVRLSTTF